MEFVQRRKKDKPAIIRFYRVSEKKNPEQFHGALLKLYLAYRSDQELKRPFLPTYKAFYNIGWVQLLGSDQAESVKAIVKRNRDKYGKNSEEIEEAVEEYEQNTVVRLECIEELQARQPEDENVQEDVSVCDYSLRANAVTEARAIREPPAIDPTVLHQMFQNLNQQQALAKHLCVHEPSQIDLWQEHFQMVTLTEIMRQKDDTAFAEMLNASV
ncbi:hypothetical protein Q8A73_003919 [Channa argus]|nr:hypothetical protein Q8A73_003919 [Channa argus]